jgi:hypothetical protein
MHAASQQQHQGNSSAACRHAGRPHLQEGLRLLAVLIQQPGRAQQLHSSSGKLQRGLRLHSRSPAAQQLQQAAAQVRRPAVADQLLLLLLLLLYKLICYWGAIW